MDFKLRSRPRWLGVLVAILAVLTVSGVRLQAETLPATSSPAARRGGGISGVKYRPRKSRIKVHETLARDSAAARTAPAKSDPAGAKTRPGEVERLRREVSAERSRTRALDKRLRQLESKQSKEQGTLARMMEQVKVGVAKRPLRNLTQEDLYQNGFFLSTVDKRFSIFVNLLDQNRFTFFKPHNVASERVNENSTSNFDVFLGRLAFSGTIFDPKLKYFAQLETITAGGSNNTHLLDWFAAYAFNPYLTIQMGRFWPLYTYEFHNTPAVYTFPDLSTAEYAFSLQRVIGAAVYGQAGRLSYWGALANPVPALDVGQQSNFTSKVALIGHLHYNLVGDYYGDVETIPDVAQPLQLTLWGSGMFTPVASGQDSSFQNTTAGDRLYGGTISPLIRLGYLSLRGTGYYRRTRKGGLGADYDSWGWNETGSYVILPPHFEVAERISWVKWGAADFLPAGFPVNNWFSNANFPTRRMTEYSLGVNYYLYGHNAKLQLWYSFLDGTSFTRHNIGANRFIIQTQLWF